MYQLALSNRAKKDLDKLTGSLWQRIRDAILALRENPRPDGVKKLRGMSANYRIRVGDYRIIYRLNEADKEVVILRVKHRRDAHRNL